MKINRLLTNVCSQNLEASKQFYTSLFSFNVDYDSDWFVHLISEGRELELGIIAQDHAVVPDQVKGKILGVYLTFVVENVDSCFELSQKLGYEIIQQPEMTPYGQKRMLLVAPEGTVCDVSSPS
ncbi:VOC family protein [Marinicellulosiphila megalodicopiae]|uniref:VOC family protein n=1 Tax=Marinicellulosiphila megalodicopiae TaxID=2724896 RepID=UPI003BAE31CC